MPFNKSPIYAVFIYLGKEVMYESAECQSIGPGVCEILNFDILKKFSISKTFPVFDFMQRIGGRARGCHMYMYNMYILYDVRDVIRLNIII